MGLGELPFRSDKTRCPDLVLAQLLVSTSYGHHHIMTEPNMSKSIKLKPDHTTQRVKLFLSELRLEVTAVHL